MAYVFYLDKIQLPVAPAKLQIKIENKNKTLSLINEGEINILKNAGLTNIEFDFLLPNAKYPFAKYKSGFQKADVFLGEIEKLKTSNEPFQFIVTREISKSNPLFETNIKVAIEDYTIKEDTKQGFDVIVSIKLKQYKYFGTKTYTIAKTGGGAKGTEKTTPTAPATPVIQTTKTPRETTPKQIGIGSSVIVNGSLYRDSSGNGIGGSRSNYNGKVNFVNNKGICPYHVTTPTGEWLGWVKKTAVKGV